MAARQINLDALKPEQVAALMAQLKERDDREAEAKKAAREAAKGLAGTVVTLITSSDVPRQTFTSGAEGWSLGGSKIVGADGNTYRVSVLLRDEATIPDKE